MRLGIDTTSIIPVSAPCIPPSHGAGEAQGTASKDCHIVDGPKSDLPQWAVRFLLLYLQVSQEPFSYSV